MDRFIRDGFTRLEQAIPRPRAAECREVLWLATGLDPADPAGWSQPVVRIHGSRAAPIVDAMNSPRLAAGIDSLVGPGRWRRPIVGSGSFPIRFPSDSDPGDAGWHIDGSYESKGKLFANVFSRGRALLLLILFSDIGEDDAPARIRRGSHRVVPRVLESAGESGLAFDEIAPRLPELEALPIDLAIGNAGDVYLCHPFLVHAASWPHRGTSPRFLGQPGVEPLGPLSISRTDRGASPVERAIALGLADAKR